MLFLSLACCLAAERVNGELRLMKAIPTAEACQGHAVESELAALIDEYYPDDQAQGFEVGDLRGAFTPRRAVK